MDDLEVEIRKSPLCCRVNDDGTHVDIEIYFDEESGWILEVVDELNGSTIWKDGFKTDQAALDEAHRVIKVDGIRSFMKDPEPHMN